MTNKTVTHKGKVYQIGSLYKFFDQGDTEGDKVLATLEGIAQGCFMASTGEPFSYCEAVTTFNMGTISKAPIELHDGGYYAFTEELSSHMIEHLGRFDKDSSNIFCGGGFNYQRHNEYFEAGTVKVLYEMKRVEDE